MELSAADTAQMFLTESTQVIEQTGKGFLSKNRRPTLVVVKDLLQRDTHHKSQYQAVFPVPMWCGGEDQTG